MKEYVLLCKSIGVDYLTITNPEYTKAFEKTLQAINKIEPGMVIYHDAITAFQNETNKKEFKSLLQDNKIIVTSPGDWKKMDKLLKKVRKEPFQLSILKKKSPSNQLPRFSPQLLASIYQNSVSFFSVNSGHLPLQAKSIGLLTLTNHSPLYSELSKYFDVSDITENTPDPSKTIIVDARGASLPFGPFLEEYSSTNHIVALVSSETSDFIEADEYIYFPENHPSHDILAAQMIYGAVGINGLSKDLVQYNQRLKNQKVRATGRLRYSPAEWEGIDSRKLEKIELLAGELISEYASPGCQITVVKG
ncbi:MAG: hypothetical protein AAFN93_29355, partial [Bacteroidota bacterium]